MMPRVGVLRLRRLRFLLGTVSCEFHLRYFRSWERKYVGTKVPVTISENLVSANREDAISFVSCGYFAHLTLFNSSWKRNNQSFPTRCGSSVARCGPVWLIVTPSVRTMHLRWQDAADECYCCCVIHYINLAFCLQDFD